MGRKKNQQRSKKHTPKTPRRASNRIKDRDAKNRAALFESESESEDIIMKKTKNRAKNRAVLFESESESDDIMKKTQNTVSNQPKSLAAELQEARTAEDARLADENDGTSNNSSVQKVVEEPFAKVMHKNDGIFDFSKLDCCINFPPSVIAVNTTFVKEISFDGEKVHPDDRSNMYLLNNTYELYQFYTDIGKKIDDDTSAVSDPDHSIAQVNSDLSVEFRNTGHENGFGCDSVNVPENTDEQNTCSNCEKMECIIKQYDSDLELKERESFNLKEEISFLNEAVIRLKNENSLLSNDLLENKLQLRRQTERITQISNGNVYRNEMNRLEKVVEVNDDDIRNLQNKVNSLTTENNRLKNISKVEPTKEQKFAEYEELNKEILQKLASFHEILSNQTSIISGQIIDHFETGHENTTTAPQQQQQQQQQQKQQRPTPPPRPPRPPSVVEKGDSIIASAYEDGQQQNRVNQTLNSTPVEQGRNVPNGGISLPIPPIRRDNGVKRAMVVSTSITQRINVQKFRTKYNGHVSFHRFHGGHVRHMKNYLATHLEEEQPDTVYIIGGGNDIPRGENKQFPAVEIARHIEEMGRLCKQYGVTRVCISSIMPRTDFHVQLKIWEMNNVLKDMCLQNNFEFIENKNVVLSEHVWKDGVHFNNEGTNVFFDNILECLSNASGIV